MFEAAKALGALALAVVVHHVVHRHPEQAAQRLVRFLHLAPRGHLAHTVITAAGYFTPAHEKVVALLVALYVVLRCTEAVGLWRERTWAEWFGIATGAIYIPFEIVEIVRRPSWIAVGVFLLNVAVVAYLAWVRLDTRARSIRAAGAGAYATSG